MRLLQYMGHHHIVWCNWQGHSNGWKLRIGFKKENYPQIVFYISWFRFYFYVCKTGNGVKFRYIRLSSHEPIYFSSKLKRTVDYQHKMIHNLQGKIIALNRRVSDLKYIDDKVADRQTALVKLYADTIRINEDYQFEERVEVSLKEELYGHEFHYPRQKRLITFKK